MNVQTIKNNFALNVELRDFLALLQEVIKVCSISLIDRAVCQCTGMSNLCQLKRSPDLGFYLC